MLTKPNEEEDIPTLLKICVEYLLAIKCEVNKNENKNEKVRSMELMSYAAICKVQPTH